MRKVIVYYNNKKECYTILNYKTKKKIANIDDVILVNASKYRFVSKSVTAFKGLLVEKFNRKVIKYVLLKEGTIYDERYSMYNFENVPRSGILFMEKHYIKTMFEFQELSDFVLKQLDKDE